MSTWHQPTKAGQQPTNETANPPLTKGRPIRFGRIRNPEPHGVRTRLQSQPRPTKRQAIWHRLLGTLLSSQGTDALSSRPAGPSREAFRFPAYQIVFLVCRPLPVNRFPDSLSAFTTLAGFSSPPDHPVCDARCPPDRFRGARSSWISFGGGRLRDQPPRFDPRCPFLPAGRPREHYA